MRISRAILSRFTDVPTDTHELRMLLDDVGIEVKRTEESILLGQPDVIFDVELLANRGDHYCYAGIARELFARTNGSLRLPSCASLLTGDFAIRISIETDHCPYYTATLIDLADAPHRLPDNVLAPLTVADMQSILPVIDVTNLVNLEIGQPTHVFDADRIVGGITIRASREGESALPLFSEDRLKLPVGTIVIADDEKILAIAGVIGCEESKAIESSRHLLLESAVFDPVSVRRTSRALGIRTDSSIRFERGGDPTMPIVGAGRAVALLEQYFSAKRRGPTKCLGQWRDPRRFIEIDPVTVNTFLGLSLASDELVKRLARYGYTIHKSGDKLRLHVPGHRLWDVECQADIYEDVAKSVGYGEVRSSLPPIDFGSQESSVERARKTVDEILVAEGFYEVFTDSFYGKDTAGKMLDSEALIQHVSVLDAVDKGHSLLKNNALIQLVEGVSDNLRMSESEIKMFEWTRTFHYDRSAANNLCAERRLLAVVCCGHAANPTWAEQPRMADAWYLKGLVNEIAKTLRVDLQVGFETSAYPLSDCLHPGRQAVIRYAGESVGIFGEVHPEVVRRTGIKQKNARPCYLEIQTDALTRPAYSVPLNDLNKRPSTRRDLAFALPMGVRAEMVLSVIRASAGPSLDCCQVVDCFETEYELGACRAITFAIYWSNADATKTTDELNAATDAVRAAIVDQLGSKGVMLR